MKSKIVPGEVGAINLYYSVDDKLWLIEDAVSGDCASFDTEELANEFFDKIIDSASLYKIMGWEHIEPAIGDKVEITATTDNYKYFSVGDKATLIRKGDGRTWWADFDDRSWKSHGGRSNDRSFAIQPNIGDKFKIIKG